MKIGKLVKSHIERIFAHCNEKEHNEINLLLEQKYSRNTFGVNFPFCIEIQNIEKSHSKRYWTEIYRVRGKEVRVTSQWYEKPSRPLFQNYLRAKGIQTESLPPEEPHPEPLSSTKNNRYRGSHIGNAQNLFVRNILGSLGFEAFNEKDWDSTKDYFSRKCAYCGVEGTLHIDHAIPINKEKLGEHRIGNLVPSCKPCNQNKGGQDFREFLGQNAAAIDKIEAYMDTKNYVPLEDNEQIKMILSMAYDEVGALADRYIRIINKLFFHGPRAQ